MKYIKSFAIFESTLGQMPSEKEILMTLKNKFPEYTKPGTVFPVEIKNSKGETVQTLEFTFDENGELHIKESVYEGKFTRGLAALCLVGGMLTSCQKDPLYDLGKDPRFVVKPQILNTLGKDHFDSPVPGKENMYVWFGNQSGASGQERQGYFDFTNRQRTYGEKPSAGSSVEHPDSIGPGLQFVIPSEVVDVNTTASTPFPLTPQQKRDYKYIVLVQVHKATMYDWSDPFNGKELPSTFGLDKLPGYAVYLTNLETIKPGEVYPTLLDYIFPDDDSRVKPLENYKVFGGENFMQSEPEI